MNRKNTRSLIKLSLRLIIFTVVILSVFHYILISLKMKSENTINFKVVKISIEKPSKYYDYDMSEQKKKELNENLTKFVYIVYEIDIKNLSTVKLSHINIQPQFSNSMKDNVYWYAETNAISDSQINLQPNESKQYSRRILVKKSNFTDDELINIAKKDKFKISYYLKGSSVFSFRFGNQLVGYHGE